jgi:hypothetical protein
MKKSDNITIIIDNPPTEKHVLKKLQDVSEFLSRELSRKVVKNNPTNKF